MNHSNLLLPHPIIRPKGFDYPNCYFNMNINQARKIDGKIHIELSYDLSSSTINNLIINKKAKFFLVLKCTKTHQRITKSSKEVSMIWDIPISDCKDRLILTPYVAIVDDIASFYSDELDNEIQQLIPNGIDLPIGSILAVGNSHEITVDSIEKFQAAIKIIGDPSVKEGIYEIRTANDYIDIAMHPKTMTSIEHIHTKARDLLYPSLYLAAIEHAIRDMEESKERKWAQALEKTLKSHNIDINYEVLREEAHTHAQTILEKPLDRLIQWNKDETND